MSSITRDLTFVSSNLGRDANLALTFDSVNIPGIYKTAFPTLWKVGHFGPSGQYEFRVRYHSEFGFSAGDAYTHINVGERTILEESGNPPIKYFSKPSPIQPPTQMEARNSTHERQNISFGLFDSPDRPPTPILVFDNVGSASSLRLEFTPILSGFINEDHPEGGILRSEISSPVLFKENLNNLDPETRWKLSYNPVYGIFTIERES